MHGRENKTFDWNSEIQITLRTEKENLLGDLGTDEKKITRLFLECRRIIYKIYLGTW